MPGVKKKDDFHELFLMNLNAHLAVEGLRQGEILNALTEYGEIAIAPTTNRSVLGSMNDLVGEVELLIHRAGGLEKADMLRVNMMLNRVPMGAIKYRFAVEKVFELFGRTDRVREIIDPFTMTFSKSKA